MIQLEEAEQIAVFQWAALYPALRWLHAIPNGGARKKATAGRLKAAGVKAGVYDIFLPVPMRGYHGLYIEMKRSRGVSKITDNQKEFGVYAKAQGYACWVCYGPQQAIDAIKEYLGPALFQGRVTP